MSLYDSCYSILRKHARVPDVSMLRSKGTAVKSERSKGLFHWNRCSEEFTNAYFDEQEDEVCFSTSDMAKVYEGVLCVESNLGTFKELVRQYSTIQGIDDTSIWKTTLHLYSSIVKLHTGGVDIVMDVLIEDFKDRSKSRISYILSQIRG